MTTTRPSTTQADTSRRSANRAARGDGAQRTGGVGRGRDMPRVPRRYGQWAATVLFLLVAVLAAGWLWQQKSDRVEVWQARVAVPVGSVITRGDLTTVEVAGVGDAIGVGAVGQLVGSTAVVGLVPGQVLTHTMVTAVPVPAAGDRVVGVAVDASRAPGGLVPGDVVTVLAAPPSGDASNPSQLQNPTVLADRATVLSVGGTGSGGTRLTLLVAQVQANRVASFGAAGRVAVLQAPAGGGR